MKSGIKSVLQFFLFLSIGVLILYLLYNKLSASFEGEGTLIDSIIEDFLSVKVFWIVVVCILFMVSNWMRAIRWIQLLEPLGYKPKVINALGSVMIAYLANLALPRIGEVVRAGTLSKYEKIPVSEVFGTVVIDRILDFLSLFVVVGLAMLFSLSTFQNYFQENFQMPASSFIAILTVLAVLGLLVLFFLNRILESKDLRNPFLLKIRGIWNGFKDGLKSVAKVKNKPLLVFNSVGIWLMYYLMTYLCFFSFVPTSHLGPIAGLVVFVFGTLGIVLPSPGGMGSYQWLVSQALIIYGIDKFDAFSFSNIMFFAVQIFCNILFGIFFLMFIPFYNKRSSN